VFYAEVPRDGWSRRKPDGAEVFLQRHPMTSMGESSESEAHRTTSSDSGDAEGEGVVVAELSRGDVIDRRAVSVTAYSARAPVRGSGMTVLATLVGPNTDEVVLCLADPSFRGLVCAEGDAVVPVKRGGSAPTVVADSPVEPECIQTTSSFVLPGVDDVIQMGADYRLVMDRVVTPSEQVVYAVTEPLSTATEPRFDRLVSHPPQQIPPSHIRHQ
jgi:hypothetical protein